MIAVGRDALAGPPTKDGLSTLNRPLLRGALRPLVSQGDAEANLLRSGLLAFEN